MREAPRRSPSSSPARPASLELRDRVILITGASRGLGAALARACAGAGARVVLCARSQGALRELAAELEGSGATVHARAADVSEPGALEALVREAAARLGPISVLINNASLLGERLPLAAQTPATWRSVLAVNVSGALYAAQAVLPGMRAARAGSIINVTSGVGNEPRAGWGAYAVSKAALEALTWNLALEEERHGVRVNAVDPGALRTAMRREAYPEEDPRTVTSPDDVVGVFLWLASDASKGVSGRRFEAGEWHGGDRFLRGGRSMDPEEDHG